MPINPIAQRFLDSLRSGGLTNEAALRVLGVYGQRESGYKPGNISGSWNDPSQSGAPGTAGGILSWRGPRFNAMRAATAGQADPVTAQAGFFLNENPGLISKLNAAPNAVAANDLMRRAWKFGGWNNPSHPEYKTRLAMAQNPDSLLASNPTLAAAGAAGTLPAGLQARYDMMIKALPANLGSVSIGSGSRTREEQQALWDKKLAEVGGNVALARKWVAPPGRSQHEKGNAFDLRYSSPEVKKWFHENAGKYGLTFPMGHEPWHIETVEARGGKLPEGMTVASGGGDTGLAATVPEEQPATAPTADVVADIIAQLPKPPEPAAPAVPPISPLAPEPQQQQMAAAPDQGSAADMMTGLLSRKRQFRTGGGGLLSGGFA